MTESSTPKQTTKRRRPSASSSRAGKKSKAAGQTQAAAAASAVAAALSAQAMSSLPPTNNNNGGDNNPQYAHPPISHTGTNGANTLYQHSNTAPAFPGFDVSTSSAAATMLMNPQAALTAMQALLYQQQQQQQQHQHQQQQQCTPAPAPAPETIAAAPTGVPPTFADFLAAASSGGWIGVQPPVPPPEQQTQQQQQVANMNHAGLIAAALQQAQQQKQHQQQQHQQEKAQPQARASPLSNSNGSTVLPLVSIAASAPFAPAIARVISATKNSISSNSNSNSTSSVRSTTRPDTPTTTSHVSSTTASSSSGSINRVVAPQLAKSSPSSSNTDLHQHMVKVPHRRHDNHSPPTVSLIRQQQQRQQHRAMFANMQNWKLGQLEAHVQFLRNANQPIPQPVALLLADARKKEEKRTAKRVANRKSACTSRARKKALVEEMTKTNARLRRQAMILSLLPDMVVAITEDGEITFCSAQVERILRHPVTDLVGAKLTDILVPSSREALDRLTSDLVATEESKETDANNKGEETTDRRPNNEIVNKAEGEESGGESSSSGAAVVSDTSFPPSEVKVQDNRTQLQGQGESASDVSNSGDNVTVVADVNNKKEGISKDVAPKKAAHPQNSSSDDSLSLSSDAKNLRKASESLNLNVRLHNAKRFGNTQQSGPASHTDDVTGQSVTANNADAKLSSLQHHPSAGGKVPTGPDSTGSKEAKNTNTKAADQPAANGMMFECIGENSASSSNSFLASVEEQKKKAQRRQVENVNENLSEDSGYREESGESPSSPEDSASLASDTSSNSRNDRRKPLAPTCNVCLIRDDLTTIWCEVTSSIRTRIIKDEIFDEDGESQLGESDVAPATTNSMATVSGIKGSKSVTSGSVNGEEQTPENDHVKELLLCLRPIRDGRETVDENLRFIPVSKRSIGSEEAGCSKGEAKDTEKLTPVPSSNSVHSNTAKSADLCDGSSSTGIGSPDKGKQRPMKKRPPRSMAELSAQEQAAKKARLAGAVTTPGGRTTDTEKSVVESLMLMSNKAN